MKRWREEPVCSTCFSMSMSTLNYMDVMEKIKNA